MSPHAAVSRVKRILALACLLAAGGAALGLTLSNLTSTHVPTHVRAIARHRSPTGKRGKPVIGARAGRRALGANIVKVASLSLTLNEPSSAAIATGRSAAGAPVRIMPTKVRFPAGPSGSAAAAGAPFPLIIFSQGFDEPVKAYAGLLNAWARAGYVVAAPTYPDTDPSSPTGVNENDIVNHPADLRYVIAVLESMSRDSRSRLHGVLNPSRLAIAGQSDGGDVSLAVAVNSCCRADGVKAAIILSGAELAAFGGTYYSGGGLPLLVTQGSRDTINPPGCSAQLYDQAPQPKYFLNIEGAQHLPPYVSPGPIRAGIARVAIAFLNAYLKRGPSSVAALRSAARLPPAEKLTGATTAPEPASNYCPGAP